MVAHACSLPPNEYASWKLALLKGNPQLNRRGRAKGFHLHLKANLTFVFIAADSKGHVPRRLGQRLLCAAEKNCALTTAILPQAQNQMLLFQNLWRRDRLNAAHEKNRLWIPLSERLEELVPAEQIPGQLAQGQFVIQMETRLEMLDGQQFASNFLKRGDESREIPLLNR